MFNLAESDVGDREIEVLDEEESLDMTVFIRPIKQGRRDLNGKVRGESAGWHCTA